MSNDYLGYPGRYYLEDVQLENFDGTSISILDLVVSLSYVEDIFSPCVRGTCRISDGLDVYQFFPICGEEKLKLFFRSDDTGPEIEKTFLVYRVGKNRAASNERETYMLFFCSEELSEDQKHKVSKSYRGLYSDAVSDLFGFLGSTKPLVVNETLGNFHVVIPNLSPLAGISWLGSISKNSKSESSLFCFYEDREGFQFQCVDSLMDQEVLNPEEPLRMTVQNQNSQQEEKFKSIGIITYNIDRGSKDVLDSRRSGMFSNQVYTLDLLTKDFKVTNYSRESDHDKLSHLDTDDLVSSNYQEGEATQKMIVQVSKTHRESSDYVAENGDGQLFTPPESISGWRTAQINQLNAITVNATMYGVTDYTCGKTVDVELPNRTSIDEKKDDTYHRYLSGKFLIRSIEHVLTRDGYFMNLVLMKDTLHATLENRLDN